MVRTNNLPQRRTMISLAAATLCGLLWTHLYLTLWFGWQSTAQTYAVSGFYAVGLAVGLALTFLADHWLLCRIRNLTIRRVVWIALAFLLVALITAALLAAQYRLYFSQWHEPFLSRDWVLQQVFTAIGAIAQYAIFGIHYHGPGALLIILVTCWWATRTKH
ncbi:MAG: hypothetical protein AAF940_10015 [Pseudomonadota bacterium]